MLIHKPKIAFPYTGGEKKLLVFTTASELYTIWAALDAFAEEKQIEVNEIKTIDELKRAKSSDIECNLEYKQALNMLEDLNNASKSLGKLSPWKQKSLLKFIIKTEEQHPSKI